MGRTIRDTEDFGGLARETEYTYVDGLRTEITAIHPTNNQTTTYTYGITKGSGTTDSAFAANNVLFTVEYPDSSGPTDVVTHAYNALGEQTYQKDQAGNEFSYLYDDAGRRTEVILDTVVTGFDDLVRAQVWTYTDRGQTEYITQYDDTSGRTSGDELDGIKYAYDGWGNLTQIHQDINSKVNTVSGDHRSVNYTWAKATGVSDNGRHTLRRTKMPPQQP